MPVFRLCLIGVFVAALSSVSSAQSTTKPSMVMPDSTHWTMGKGVLSGYQVALLSGDPNKNGMYIVRIKLPANDKEPPHYHSSLETVTVISGTIYLGLGPKFDVRKMTAFPAGSFASIPAHVIHYGMTRAPAVIQVEGIGPYSMTPVKTSM